MLSSMGTRRYQIREKLFTLDCDLVIKDEKGISVYNVRSKLVFEDMAGNQLYKIERDYWACFKFFKLISPLNNVEVALVKKQFSSCFHAFSINSIYGRYELVGSINAHSFTLTKNGMTVASFDKQFFGFTYGVEIVKTEYPGFILALVIFLIKHVRMINNY